MIPNTSLWSTRVAAPKGNRRPKLASSSSWSNVSETVNIEKVNRVDFSFPTHVVVFLWSSNFFVSSSIPCHHHHLQHHRAPKAKQGKAMTIREIQPHTRTTTLLIPVPPAMTQRKTHNLMTFDDMRKSFSAFVRFLCCPAVSSTLFSSTSFLLIFFHPSSPSSLFYSAPLHLVSSRI